MHRDGAMHQKSMDQIELPLEDRGEAPSAERSGEAKSAASGDERSGLDPLVMERVIDGGNLRRALKRVQQNEGSPGVDGLTVDELPAVLKRHWPAMRVQLLTGRYQPSAVKRVESPKPGGGVRMLGIPTVLDRFIQQAVLQVVQPAIDPTFSNSSYGFRPGRSAHDAVCRAQRYVQNGRRWVVDVDLEKFFDRAARRKAVPYRRCWRTCCSTWWTSSSSDAATALCATPMTAMCTCSRSEPRSA